MWLLPHRNQLQAGGESVLEDPVDDEKELKVITQLIYVWYCVYTSLSKAWPPLSVVHWSGLGCAMVVIAAELSETSPGKEEAWDPLPLFVWDLLVEVGIIVEYSRCVTLWVIWVCLPFKAWCGQMSEPSHWLWAGCCKSKEFPISYSPKRDQIFILFLDSP